MLRGMTRAKTILVALVLAVAVFAVAPVPEAAPLQAGVTAIRAGRLIEPDTGTVATDQIILVAGGRISAVGRGLAIPTGATVIDLSKASVMPGLVDAHTHLCMQVIAARDHGSYYYTTLNDPDAFRAVQGTANARTMLEAGFTSVRDVGNEGNYACVQVRKGIMQGLIPGPTMVTAGRIIAPFGGQFQLQPDKPGLAEPEYAFADTRDEMIKAVRQNAHFGATVIKIVVDDQRYIYSVDDIKFIKAEAARAGLKLAAHAWTRAGAQNAAEAGVDSNDHGIDMTDEILSLAKKNNVALVGTEFLVTSDSFDGAFRTQVVDRLRRAFKISVTLVYGTDVIAAVDGKTRGEVAISGVDPWVEAGIPAQAILKAMTTEAPRLLGLDAVRGSIKVGQAADLIATVDDPLANIVALKKVQFVMKDGRIVRQ